MGTRGMWGYIVGEEEKLTYNHFDSYPSGLGNEILKHARSFSKIALAVNSEPFQQAVNLLVVDADSTPTKEQIEHLAKYANTDVSTRDLEEWYVLLRETQGDPVAQLDAGVMIDGADFSQDSLFCEWAYVIDLDLGLFEVYRGFQKEPHEDGRFWQRFDAEATHMTPPLFDEDERPARCLRCGVHKLNEAHKEVCTGGAYYPIRLIASWRLDNLPDSLDEVEKKVYEEDEAKYAS